MDKNPLDELSLRNRGAVRGTYDENAVQYAKVTGVAGQEYYLTLGSYNKMGQGKLGLSGMQVRVGVVMRRPVFDLLL